MQEDYSTMEQWRKERQEDYPIFAKYTTDVG